MKPFNLLSICQCLAFPTYTLVLITCTSILTATPLASTALLQHTRQCPCDFIVRTHAESGPFNFVLSPVRHESAQFSETLLALSRFNQTKRTAYRTTSEHAYHRLWVPVYGNVRLTVHTLGLVSDTLRNFSERAYIFPDDRQSDTCDVLIRQDPPDRSRNTTARIVGGLPANSKLAKSLAFLEIEVRKDGQSQLAICTATIIGPRTLITAAHCKGSGRAEAIIGERQISGNERSYEVESFTTHPRYAGSDVPEIVQFDIAIINLAQNITGDFKIMKYNKNDSLPKADGLVRSVGYGVTYEEKQDYGQLLQVDLIAQSDDECETRHRRVDIDLNSDRILCAGRTDRDGCGICNGDSGGPLIYYGDDDEPILVGVVSSSVRCGNDRFPGLYVRTSAHVDFIQGNYEPTREWVRPTIITAVVAGVVIIIAAIAIAIERFKR